MNKPWMSRPGRKNGPVAQPGRAPDF